MKNTQKLPTSAYVILCFVLISNIIVTVLVLNHII